MQVRGRLMAGWFLGLVLAAATAVPVAAQNATVHGVVTDSATGRNLEGALVSDSVFLQFNNPTEPLSVQLQRTQEVAPEEALLARHLRHRPAARHRPSCSCLSPSAAARVNRASATEARGCSRPSPQMRQIRGRTPRSHREFQRSS